MFLTKRIATASAAKFALRIWRPWSLVCVIFCSLPMGKVAAAPAGMTEETLAPRSGPQGKTMFVEMPAEQTGIVTENRYADPKMWGERYNEFEVGAIGTGVAIGDYDNDGRPDIFVVSKTESCRLFRNLGNWKFEDVTEKAGVGDKGEAAATWKQGVTFVDINNDGLLDIYICRFNAPNLLYINQGDGTFKESAHAYGLDVKDASVMAAFCDYDRDGWLDVFIQTNLLDAAAHPNGQKNYLFHNNRDGTFTNVTDRAGITGEGQGHSAIWWDYDHDGWPDLYVSNDFSGPDKLYHNNRDGTFTDVINQVVPHTPFSSMGADLGDINNDGWVDFLASDMAATTHQKDQRTVAIMRSFTTDLPDGAPIVPQYMHNALYVNTGTGHMLEAAHLAGLAATDWTWSVRFEDLDNDGRLDLFVTNGMNRETHNADLTARKLTADTIADKVQLEKSTPVLNESHLAFRNLGNLAFEDVSAAWGLNQKGVSFGAAFGDLDGDGDLDLVYANFQGGVTVMRNDSESGHRLIVALKGTQSNRFGVGALVKIETTAGVQVRPLVLARGILSSSEPVLHFGLGDETRIKRLTISWPNGQVQAFVDLAVDRKYTIVEPALPLAKVDRSFPPQNQRISLYNEVSESLGLSVVSGEQSIYETTQEPLLPMRQNRRGPALAVGDVDGDGRDDLVLGGTATDPLRVMIRGADDKFTVCASGISAGDNPLNDGPVLLFDADGNGTNDLLVTKSGSSLPAGSAEYQTKLYLNDGRGHFHPATPDALPELLTSAGAAAAADFNRDGKLDLFIGGRVLPGQYPQAPRSALLINRGGKFEDVTDTLAPGLRNVGLVTSALWSDVDGDGWLDLLVTLEWGTVKCFHNRQGQGFDDWSDKLGFTAAGTGWWTSIAGADFNGDGRIDYVVGNVGLNTPYHADPQHPALLYSGDFKGSGSTQLIEAYYEGERIYPWRTRRDLGSSIPSILKKYPRNDAYARASLGEILGEDKLKSAQHFAATEFRSGVFLSQPDGTYRFEPLPRLAQISPVQGLVVGDFDGDGRADIYAVQNSYSPIPSMGRFDGGLSLLLRGDGHGQFEAVAPAESGLIVPGDAKALVVLTLGLDARPGFVVTRNNSTPLVFQGHPAVGGSFVTVKLHGSAGNLTAIGALVTVEYNDGTREAREVSAGSGYLSQSTADLSFGITSTHFPVEVTLRWPNGVVSKENVARDTHAIVVQVPKR